ncbi:MAG: serine/threonine protein phosphatase [Pirellulales bacterium]|nr:serine/threonine protein phosphatase [Pirellulales bacterium]
MSSARTFAIGDIHGCAQALAKVLQQIDPQPADTIITLGDYVNRGPDTRGVIEQLLALRERCHLVTLLGNHDEVLLDILDGRAEASRLMRAGGQQTIDSYRPGGSFADIPSEHVAFLRACRMYFETETHLFAHGCYDPIRLLAETAATTLLWQRLVPPYPAPHCSGKRVIVGHTAQRDYQVLDLGHVVCIDTGCCYGGVLTAIDVATNELTQARQEG